MRCPSRLLGLLGAALAAPAAAAPPAAGFDVEHLRFGAGGRDDLATTSPRVAGDLQVGAGVLVQFSKRPLVGAELRDGKPVRVGRPVIDNRLESTFYSSVGLLDRMEVSVALPAVLYQDGMAADVPDARPAGAGDVRLGVKLVLAEAEEVGADLADATRITFPSGDPGSYRGDGFVTASPGLVVGRSSGRLRGAAERGVTLREGVSVGNLDVGSQVFYRAAAGYRLVPETLELVAEVFGLTSVSTSLPDEGDGVTDESPLEALLSARLRVTGSLFLTLGGAGGLVGGYGTPLYRLLIGVGWVPSDRDGDGDGLPDRADQCPERAEDRDGFEDDDGCPDPDNDGDGVPDEADRCPGGLEDRDGHEDDDGCPDPDDDGDGVPDGRDGCPAEAEDPDGFEDGDGCPDPDNDGDSVADQDDLCPLEAEDRDGFADGDGCPDPDNDGDGLDDGPDACPDEAEDADGFEDDDGCPDPDPTAAERRGDRIVTPRPIGFVPGDVALAEGSAEVLSGVASVIARHSEIRRVRVEVHVAASGRPAEDLALSRRRASTVLRALVELGVDPTLVMAVGVGSDRSPGGAPAEPDERIDFVVVQEGAP